ncbi:MAG: family 43 glycosylhydrolase [Fibrobacter sp.]|nr:family 43 glycosylhydrolase [Fibrobacter sp.]
MGFGLNKKLGGHSGVLAAVSLAMLANGVFAADWYAKDNRQGGHDPTMFRDENGYILMSTNNNLAMSTSEDMVKWASKGRALSDKPNWDSWLHQAVGGKHDGIWAPDLFRMGNKYGIFYCGSVFGQRTSAIGLATNSKLDFSNPSAGWADQGEIVRTTNSNNYNAIDADVVQTANGEYWMTYGSWNAGGIRLVKLDPNTGKQASDDKTNYQIASRGGKGIEGPSLIEHDGKYFLFTAWDVCCKQGNEIEQTTYKTAMGRADKVNGTYYDRSGKKLNDGGGTILMQRYSRYVGPGGGEAFKDLNRIRFVHHYYDLTGDKFNHIHIRDVVFTDDNWPEMGQPFLGRYLSAEAEHGAMTRAVSGDITFNYTNDASNGEYVGYINTKGSKIRLPMNIMQAGDYIMRYRYANGGDADATHKVTVNGKSQTVKLPKTGAWGNFPENSVAMIPATLKRGGNFIEVEPDQNFAELDRIDFLRVIRDTIPANGFDNGIKVRLTDKDQFAIKAGGYAIFENVVTDSIKSTDVKIQLQQCSGGTLSIRDGSKSGTELSKCTIPSTCGTGTWTEVSCSATAKLKGVKDFYLAATGNSGEVLVGNIKFGNGAPAPAASSSSVVPAESSSSVVNPPASSGSEQPASSSSEEVTSSSSEGSTELSSSDTATESSSSTDTEGLAKVAGVKLGYSVARNGNGYTVSFDKVGNYNLFVMNSMGQVIKRQAVSMQSEVQVENLPQGNFIFRVVKR